MIHANANEEILLEEFYTGQFYLLEIGGLVFTKVSDDKNVKNKKQGFVSFENCGLFKKQKMTFAIFCIKEKPYILINNNLIDVYREKVKIRFDTFFPLVQKLILSSDGYGIECSRWSKDIDEFLMDDFFYFLEFSFKQDFNNLCLNESIGEHREHRGQVRA